MSDGPPLIEPQRCLAKSNAVTGAFPRLLLSRVSNASRSTADFERRSCRATTSSCAARASGTLQVIVVTPGKYYEMQTQAIPIKSEH